MSHDEHVECDKELAQLQTKLDDTFSGMGKLQIQLDKAEERNIQWAVESKKVCQELVDVQAKLEKAEAETEQASRQERSRYSQSVRNYKKLKKAEAQNKQLREFIEEVSFQSCCSWCEKNMKIQKQILKENKQ